MSFVTALKMYVGALAIFLKTAELEALVLDINDELDRRHESAERAEAEIRESILRDEEDAGNRVLLDKQLGADKS
jgi:GTP cyclohydrolase FolE2